MTPLLSAANWGGQGLHLRGNVEGFLNARSPQKWLDLHVFEHWTEFYTRQGIALQKRFFGHFLKEEDNGWGAEPRVQMVVRHPGNRFSRRSAAQWPLPDTQWIQFYLDLSDCSLRSDPCGDVVPLSFEALSDGVTFVTPPLTQELHIIGASAAKLFVSSSTEDADLFLILRLFSPDFNEVTFSGSNDPHTPLAHGWLRASHRKLDRQRSLPYRPYHTHDEVQKLVPGQVYELDIEIWPTCIIAPQGYRLALSIRGKDYVYPGDPSGIGGRIGQPATGVGPFRHGDKADRAPELYAGITTLHSGPKDQPYLLLPAVPASSTSK